jgi:hypothetical protein
VEPISEAEVTRVARSYAGVVHDLGLACGDALLVLPNGEFFPDTFTGDQGSVELMLARLLGYTALDDVTVSVQLVGEVDSEAGCGTGGCGTGACATPSAVAVSGTRLVSRDDDWLIEVPVERVADPFALGADLARALGAVALLDRHPAGAALTARADQVELASVALGLGALLFQASYQYSKGCGGPHVRKNTALDVRSLAICFALFLAREGFKPKQARAELGVTQRAALGQAWDLVSASKSLVEGLQRRPERVAAGRFRMDDSGSWLSRIFSRSARPADRQSEALEALERGASADEVAALLGGVSAAGANGAARPKRAKDPELDSLVREALEEARIEASGR